MNIRKLYDRIPIRLRISVGLVGMMTSTVLIASALGFFPNEQREILRGRAKMCETIAISSTAMASTGELDSLRVTLESIVARDTQIRSMSLARQGEEAVVTAGPHASLWNGDDEQNVNQMRVPVFRHAKEWGELQVVFESTGGFAGLNYWAPAWLLILMIPACLAQFSIFLRKTLESLDPNGAVPDHVQGALNSLTVGLLLIDSRGRVLFANQELETAIDIETGSLVGGKASAVEWILSGDDSLLPWDKCSQTGQMVHSQIVQFNRENRRLTFSVNCAPILGQGYMVTMEDITLLEENKVELAKARDAAEQASESKSAFLANMSHEIRTPLNAVLGFTDVLRRGLVTDSDEAVDHLNMIHRSGAHLLELINDILDLSKIEAGRMQVESIETHVDEIILDVVNVLSVRARENDLSLTYDFATPIPRTIQSDPTRLRQVITNLVGNAIKFTSEGEVKIATRIVGQDGQSQIRIDVVDSGIGMTEEQQAKIFEAFSQADETTTRKFGGTGLGLSISRRLTEALGGELSVTSKPNVGSTFTISIPVSITESTQMATPSEIQQNAERQADAAANLKLIQLPAKRILVVDDGHANRQLISLVLTRAGAEVATVENGLEAIKALSKQDYSLVFMDMQMPVMDGYTATTKLRECGLETPIIALTGNAMKGDRDKCMNAGCDDFLSKPVNLDALLERTAFYIGTATSSNTPASGEACDVTETSAPLVTTSDSDNDGPIYSTLPMDDEDFREIVADFVGRLDDRFEAIESALRRADYADLQGQAHWLKGSGGTVGLGVFTEPARQLENAAKAHDHTQAAEILKEIRSIQSRVVCPADEARHAETRAPSPMPTENPSTDAKPIPDAQSSSDKENPVAGDRGDDSTSDESIHTSLPVDDPEFCEIIIDFIVKLDERLAQMQTMVQQQQFDDLANAAHWLKGAGGTVGFPQLMLPSQSLMLAAQEGSAQNTIEYMDQIMTVRRRIVTPAMPLVATS